MSGKLLVGLSVFLFSVNGLLNRILMKNEKSDPYTQTVVYSGLTGIIALVILLLRGGPHSALTIYQLPMFMLIAILAAVGGLFVFKGFKYIEASEHTILLTSSRIWVVIGAILVLGEILDFQKLIGAVIIILGVIIAEWRRNKLVLNFGAIYVLMAAIFYATGEVFSFYVLRNFDSVTFLAYVAMMIAIAMILWKPGSLKNLSFYKKRNNMLNILIVAINDTVANLLVFMAYQTGRNALQIGPLMATQTIVTVILAMVILRETDRLPQKIAGATAAVLGTIFLL